MRLDPRRLNTLRSLKRAGQGLVEQVIRLFLETTPNTMARLRVAAVSGNASEISRAAHALRGSSRELGADRLGQLCEDIEGRVRAAKVFDAAGMLPELEQEYKCVRQLLLQQIEPAPAARPEPEPRADPALEQGSG
jgi:HPt (histidine-containing phosphotransfer) domain-containing protein